MFRFLLNLPNANICKYSSESCLSRGHKCHMGPVRALCIVFFPVIPAVNSGFPQDFRGYCRIFQVSCVRPDNFIKELKLFLGSHDFPCLAITLK